MAGCASLRSVVKGGMRGFLTTLGMTIKDCKCAQEVVPKGGHELCGGMNECRGLSTARYDGAVSLRSR